MTDACPAGAAGSGAPAGTTASGDSADSGESLDAARLALAHRYPPHWVVDVLAKDGGAVALRPIVPEDAPLLEAFHETLSERTRYMRFFGPYPTLSPKDLDRFTVVDHHDRVAFVMVLGGRIIAVGRYERLNGVGDGKSAEVAFVVADDQQGRGLGPILLEHLAAAAAENGLNRFVAEVLSENRNMIAVFRAAGYELSRSFEEGIIRLEFAIDPTEAVESVRNDRELAAESRSVRNALAPQSVAVIGASSDPHKVGGAVLANLLRSRFNGPVYPVNDEHRAVQGVRAYASVRDIPDAVDLAVVAVPAEQIDAVLGDCLAKGVKSLVVVSAGFSESGSVGRERERQLVHAARQYGMRIIGPNALGIANTDPLVSLNATLAPELPPAGTVGFFCQSGALGIAILDVATRRGLGISSFVSAGNRADVSGNDLLQFWETDPSTEVVLLYLESFGNPRKFFRIAQRLSRSKPVIAVQSTRSGAPAAATPPADRSDDAVMTALLAHAGVVQVESIGALFDVALFFAYQPLPKGPALAVVGNAPALAAIATTTAQREGLQPTRSVDLGPTATPDSLAEAVAAALADPEVDLVHVLYVPPIATDPAPVAARLRAELAGAEKPVVTTFLAAEGVPEVLATLGESGAPVRGSVPSYPTPERAIAVLGHAVRYVQWRAHEASAVIRPGGVDLDRARSLMAAWTMGEQPEGWLDDEQTAQLLDCYGLPYARFTMVDEESKVMAAADALGYPVVVKAAQDEWRHRPDLAGVRLDLTDRQSVRAAYRDLAKATGNPVVQVQRMAPKGIGCAVRVRDDPTFGPIISFGLAGVISGLLGDRAYRIVPVTERDAADLIEEPKASPLLSGYQSGLVVDKPALRDIIVRISTLADDLPQVRELVCAPILANAAGAVITDMRIKLGPETGPIDLGPRRLR